MINRIIKNSAIKSLQKDLSRLDKTREFSDVRKETDIPYVRDAEDERSLDVYYVPDGKSKPVIIDVHGGGFISEDKEMDSLFANHLAHSGFVVFEINYRLAYPRYTVFDQIKDVNDAALWVTENAPRYEGDIDRMHICGHSAGAVLALAEALMSLDGDMQADYAFEARRHKYRSVILDCGTMHFYKKSIAYWGMRGMVFPKGYKRDPRYKYLVFENNENLKKLPPVRLITNVQDELKDMTYYFADLLKGKGISYDLYGEGEGGHMGVIFEPYAENNRRVMEAIKGI
ncbi:MAG TPA: hypothetical protein DCW41_03245 [Clostridiales bacterium]|nr:hypothetical protein [Clostridiales bacterium]